jgi:hypothetical protein
MNTEAAISISLTDEEIKKFWSRTRQSEISDCILWVGNKKETGYGLMKVRDKKWYAHRLSYIFNVGAIPLGMEILHSCDTPACINPKHLSYGTHAENLRQASVRGRLKGLKGDLSSSRRFPECRPRGRMNHFSKLNEEKVAEILFYSQYRAANAKDLAASYGVAYRTIMDILERKTWIHVPFPTIEILVQLAKLPENTASQA